MSSVDPAQFYTGLVAELYAPLKSVTQDPEPYARFIAASGEPALELGCGDGDPLLELRRRGLDVEGVDSSGDMLDRCRRRAATEGIEVVLHHQRMESLDLRPKTFRSIFLAGPTFNLLPDDATAVAALRAIRSHLTADGGALVPLFVPEPTPPERLGDVREASEANGATIRFSAVSEQRDEVSRTQETLTRYERRSGRAAPEVLERPWLLHWYTQDGFRSLAAQAGLETVMVLDGEGRRADADAAVFVMLLRVTDR